MLRLKANDSFTNLYSGLNTLNDVRSYTTFEPEARLDYNEIKEIIRSNPRAKALSHKRVDDSLAPGYTITINNDPKVSSEVCDFVSEIGFNEALLKALYFMRDFGGGAILVNINKGRISQQELAQPLKLSTVKSIDSVTVFSSRQLYATTVYANPLSPKYGLPARYRVLPMGVVSTDKGLLNLGTSEPLTLNEQLPAVDSFPEIHESRLICIRGPYSDAVDIQRNRGWGNSLLDIAYKDIRDYDYIIDIIKNMLITSNARILTIPDLGKITSEDEAKEQLSARLNLLNLGMSVANLAVLDGGSSEDSGAKGETLKRDDANLANIEGLLSQMATNFASVDGYPRDILFGDSPKGMNASGEGSRRNYYDSCKQFQEHVIIPAIKSFITILLASKGITDAFKVSFNGFDARDEEKEARVKKTIAETDHIYVQDGVLTPKQVTDSRFSGVSVSAETSIDSEISEGSSVPPEVQEKIDAEIEMLEQMISLKDKEQTNELRNSLIALILLISLKVNKLNDSSGVATIKYGKDVVDAVDAVSVGLSKVIGVSAADAYTPAKAILDRVIDKIENIPGPAAGDPLEAWKSKILEGLSTSKAHIDVVIDTLLVREFSRLRWAALEAGILERPYGMYVSVLDDKTTSICRALNGTCLPLSDSWWAQYKPPNHIHCRGVIVGLTLAEALVVGITHTKPMPSHPVGWHCC